MASGRSPQRPVPCVLAIAGSDSGGGAGIQADLKAFARCGVHGTCAITAVTAQNTLGVQGVHLLPAEIIVEQVRSVVVDLGVDAVKIGMLGSAGTADAVAQALELIDDDVPVVVDPVMVAESGATLLEPAARAVLVERILPRATVTTPNLPEARELAGEHGDAEALARAVHALGPSAVLVTGGHREEATDVLFDGREVTLVPGERHPDGAAHGSGCTHSSVLAARLALGDDLVAAARAARRLAGEAVARGLRGMGGGPGPVNVVAPLAAHHVD